MSIITPKAVSMTDVLCAIFHIRFSAFLIQHCP